jgi:hypothetical protein
MKTETLDQFLNRGGKVKKVDFSEAHFKNKWGRSKYDYINSYKIKKQNKLKSIDTNKTK